MVPARVTLMKLMGYVSRLLLLLPLPTITTLDVSLDSGVWRKSVSLDQFQESRLLVVGLIGCFFVSATGCRFNLLSHRLEQTPM